MSRLRLLSATCLAVCSVLIAQDAGPPPPELPAPATRQLSASLSAASRHRIHVWRDTAPFNADRSVNAYIEIAQGDRRKWEFSMERNGRVVDRVIPEDIGGYPVNYGFVPQTISYDGDPFDALVVGPSIPGGQFVRGVIVGRMLMEDEKGWDAKVVLSRTVSDGRPLHALGKEYHERIRDYFPRYKTNKPDTY